MKVSTAVLLYVWSGVAFTQAIAIRENAFSISTLFIRTLDTAANEFACTNECVYVWPYCFHNVQFVVVLPLSLPAILYVFLLCFSCHCRIWLLFAAHNNTQTPLPPPLVFENREKMVLVMEFAAGGELYDYLSERKVLTEDEARRIFRQIATAVYYCHKHKICHRDLKLENILLDENGNAKVSFCFVHTAQYVFELYAHKKRTSIFAIWQWRRTYVLTSQTTKKK